ncbi:unnamed protein product [Amoebophrya sp. A25]|nr:unnamed protein product [Amoebophrya sp. A25]|eukprot:GSA25T00024844001.1
MISDLPNNSILKVKPRGVARINDEKKLWKKEEGTNLTTTYVLPNSLRLSARKSLYARIHHFTYIALFARFISNIDTEDRQSNNIRKNISTPSDCVHHQHDHEHFASFLVAQYFTNMKKICST